jgi:hypothetical protein
MVTVANMLIAGFIVWSILSIIYVITHLGDKTNPDPDPWYIWVLGMPVLILSFCYGILFIGIPKKVEKWFKNDTKQ